jgi:hypothetical protein
MESGITLLFKSLNQELSIPELRILNEEFKLGLLPFSLISEVDRSYTETFSKCVRALISVNFNQRLMPS